ncbi:MAG: class I SAM-dependent methyltransferase [Saprospiraceae bacterium]|nr:class I SAM-dependent methyltransferase [Saprospiraceae bacterium]
MLILKRQKESYQIKLIRAFQKIEGAKKGSKYFARAKKKANDENLIIEFQKQDARSLTFTNEFDVAIMFYEGGFPLMETDEMNYEILKSVTKSLKEKCKFIFTTLNGLFPLYHSIEKFLDSEMEDGNAKYQSNTFNLMTFRDYYVTEIEDDSGIKRKLECNERYYMPSEITWLLKSLNYTKIGIFGAKIGAFSRKDKLSTEDFEMLVIAEKCLF